jgi:triacylglycerol lipase
MVAQGTGGSPPPPRQNGGTAPSEPSAHPPPHLTPTEAENLPTWRAAYSDRTSALMAAFSELAYLPFEDGADGRDQLKAALDNGKFKLVDVFNKDDTRAYFAVRPDQFAVLAFRGTTDFNNWKTNLQIGRVPLPERPDIKVHEGFLAAFRCCETEIRAAVDSIGPDLGLYITGHSLGGALAQIASAVLERDNLAACYTYGSPRVGQEAFDRLVKCPHYRLVNNWDIVPGVPFPSPWGYRHTGDPRLLEPSRQPEEALRQDRDPVSRYAIDIWALVVGLISRKFLVVDDHMIWNYRRQLEAIAAARRGMLR